VFGRSAKHELLQTGSPKRVQNAIRYYPDFVPARTAGIGKIKPRKLEITPLSVGAVMSS
jgi:hypothetical protein